MATIFHLALASEWAAAQESGAYTTSTLGRTLAEEGFIHASRADQWTGVRDRFYAEITEPLVLLQIDTDLLDVPVIEEPPFAGAAETFPHIYGPLRPAAVVKAIPLTAHTPTGPTPLPAAAPTPARPEESFTKAYFREMYFNAALVLLIFASVVIGAGAASAIHSGPGPLPAIGGAIGLALGGWGARTLYVRHHATQRAGAAPSA